MYISVIQDDEVENEIDIQWHCQGCCKTTYGWSDDQYEFVKKFVEEDKPIPIPFGIDTASKFGMYICSVNVGEKK